MDSWMAKVPSGKLLCDIVIPGSHDAGMYVTCDKNNNVVSSVSEKVITQSYSIGHQLQQGYRMFDLRIYKKTGGLTCGHFTEKKILFGGRGKTDKFGAFGAPLSMVLKDVNDFLSTQNSKKETVILKFSHIHEKNRSAVMSEVNKQLRAFLIDRRLGNLATVGNMPLGLLRGKVLAIYEEGFVGEGPYKDLVINFINPKKKKKNEELAWKKLSENEKKFKLIIRGYYANKRSYKSVATHQTEKILKQWKKNGGKKGYPGELLQLYWTSTWHPGCKLGDQQNIAGNTAPLWTKSAIENLKKLIVEYKPNVVITDFADKWKAEIIIS